MINTNDFKISGALLNKYLGDEKDVVVPKGIIAVERKAFAEWIASQKGHITSSKIKVERNLETGRKITVISGSLKDLKGKIINIYKDTKVTVEIPFLDDVKRVNLPIEIIKEDAES